MCCYAIEGYPRTYLTGFFVLYLFTLNAYGNNHIITKYIRVFRNGLLKYYINEKNAYEKFSFTKLFENIFLEDVLSEIYR